MGDGRGVDGVVQTLCALWSGLTFDAGGCVAQGLAREEHEGADVEHQHGKDGEACGAKGGGGEELGDVGEKGEEDWEELRHYAAVRG